MWARRDRAVAWLPLFLLWLLCAGFPPLAGAAVPSWHKERPLPQAESLADGTRSGQGRPAGARVAITSAGDVAVAWVDGEKGLSVAVRPAGGPFGSPQRLSRSGRWVDEHPLVADSRGALVVVWADGECCRVPADQRVWASTRQPGGRFSSPVALSGPLSGLSNPFPGLAAGDDGSRTVVWSRDTWGPDGGVIKSEIEAVDRLPSGGFGPPMPVSPPDVRAGGPRIASGPSGETVVLWSTESCPPLPCSQELFASTRAPGGQFGAPERVAVPAGSGDMPGWLAASQVQIASDGTVVAVWREGLQCMYCFGADVKAARRPPGQRFGSPETLGHLGGSGPWLVLDAEDRAFALWGDANTERFALDRNPRVFAAEAAPHEAFGRGTPLQRGGDALGIATGDGRAIAAWTRNSTVVAAVHRQGGFCRQPISRRSAQPDGDIAANSRGDAVAVWAAPRTYRTNRVMVAVGPADDRSPVVKRLSVIGRVGVRPRLRFVLSEAAEVHISVERRVGRRYRPVRSLVRSMPAGPNEVSYGGRAGRLRPGRYRALIGARDCDRRRSKSQAVPFVVNG